MNIQTCKFVTISEVCKAFGIPKGVLDVDFFDVWPFGNYDKALISKQRFANHCIERNETDLADFMNSIPDDIYIDLEN